MRFVIIIIVYIQCFLFCSIYCASNNNNINLNINVRAPSIFRPDEVVYHKYSAILAATEPFKTQFVTQVKSVLGPFHLLSAWIRGMLN